jgi:hypothetical protein
LYTNTDGQALLFVPNYETISQFGRWQGETLHPKPPPVSTPQTLSTLIAESKTGVEKTPVLLDQACPE